MLLWSAECVLEGWKALEATSGFGVAFLALNTDDLDTLEIFLGAEVDDAFVDAGSEPEPRKTRDENLLHILLASNGRFSAQMFVQSVSLE